jgi:hypothetical protein
LTAIKFLIPFLFALVGLLAFVFLFRSADPSPGVAPAIAGAPANADPVARGECLAKAAGCVACTPFRAAVDPSQVRVIAACGYQNRSEAIRDLARAGITQLQEESNNPQRDG